MDSRDHNREINVYKHPRHTHTQARAHFAVTWMKGGAREASQGSAEPLVRHQVGPLVPSRHVSPATTFAPEVPWCPHRNPMVSSL